MRKWLPRIADYVEQGGHSLATFKTAFTNENVKVYSGAATDLNRCFGVSYSHFTYPNHLQLATDHYFCGEKEVRGFLEGLNVEQNSVQGACHIRPSELGTFCGGDTQYLRKGIQPTLAARRQRRC